jgi:hypothetical protein
MKGKEGKDYFIQDGKVITEEEYPMLFKMLSRAYDKTEKGFKFPRTISGTHNYE